MPTYAYKCLHCGEPFDAVRPMLQYEWANCPHCPGQGAVKFSPNANISIPARFALSRHWHMPDTPSPDSGTAAGNNMVHSPKRKSFKEAFNENWSKAGGS
jgi:putative FmdB family regulatory protein